MEQLVNDYTSLLAADIDTTATELEVLAAPPNTPQFRLRIDAELLICTAVNGTTLTVTRAAEDTTAASHASGALVSAVLTRDAVNAFVAERLAERRPELLVTVQTFLEPQTMYGGNDNYLLYPNVQVDTLEAWNPETGVFTAPFHGIYTVQAKLGIVTPVVSDWHTLTILATPYNPAAPVTQELTVEGIDKQLSVFGVLQLDEGDTLQIVLFYAGDFTQEETFAEQSWSALTITYQRTDPPAP